MISTCGGGNESGTKELLSSSVCVWEGVCMKRAYA